MEGGRGGEGNHVVGGGDGRGGGGASAMGERPSPSPRRRTEETTRVGRVTGSQVQRFLAGVRRALPGLPVLPLLELSLPATLDDGGGDDGTRGKHSAQEESILAHLERVGALAPPRSPPSSEDDDGGGDGGRCDDDDDDSSSVVAVELGAGTGRLSDRLHRVTGGRFGGHVLVDRRTDLPPLALRERYMRARDAERGMDAARGDDGGVKRLVQDIADFDFVGCGCGFGGGDACRGNGGRPPPRRAVYLSKHLCGPAADLAVEGIIAGARATGAGRTDGTATATATATFCALATCCHYLCTWEEFSGREYWTDALGLTEEDFAVAAATSQWYTMMPRSRRSRTGGDDRTTRTKDDTGSRTSNGCRDAGAGAWTSNGDGGFTASSAGGGGEGGGNEADDGEEGWLPDLSRLAREATSAEASADAELPQPQALVPSDEFERTFPREDKVELGRTAKVLIDLCRAARLQQKRDERSAAFRVKLVRYTTRSIEDRLLVAMAEQGR